MLTLRYLILIGLLGAVSATAAEESHFFQEVVPILQRRCIGCHNDSDAKGDLSLQSSTSVMDGGFLEPGSPEGSRLLDVVIPTDGKAEMPRNADPLTPAEIAVLRKWIEGGANWPTEATVSEASVTDFDWWSLAPLKQPQVPPTQAGQLIRTPVDAFIYQKREEQGLSGSPEADRRTLIRRLYFDLLGLPPTPTEVERFVNDADDRAYENLVDELLDSKHYGERWARHWLDVVHYADTHGYDKDKLRPNAWPYRDYVIRAFNEDRPYQRFVREQIAGDVLWPNELNAITATGFIAAGPWDFIGHAEVPETKIDGRIARNLDRDDMVTSTMNTFTSTTVQCARCHNHKFDPVTQEHYYGLQTVFAALDRAERTFDREPEVARRRRQLMAERKAAQSREAKAAEKIRELGGEQLKELNKQIDQLNRALREDSGQPAFGYHSQLAESEDTTKWVQVDLGEVSQIDRIDLIGAHDDYAGIGAGFGFPVRFRIEISNDAVFGGETSTVADLTDEDVPNPGCGRQEFGLPKGSKARYVRITATKLAKRADAYNFALSELLVLRGDNNIARDKTVTAMDSIEAPVRWQRKNLVDGHWYGQSQKPDIRKELDGAKAARNSLLAKRIPQAILDAQKHAAKELESISSSLKELPEPGRVYAGMIHTGGGAFKGTGANGGKPRTIHVLHRGDILQPRQLAVPGRIPLGPEDSVTFELDPMHAEGDRRVALADWIVDPNNPLTWRSIVNRVWQYHFGRGIVETPNDFGRMGAQPTHPALLDWLAVEFRDGGQSFKALHRLIVNSSTYRQASTVTSQSNVEADSGNRFLWRMNRRRLSAEEVRDAVLHVSGQLDETMYGPGMRLFVLERPEHSPHYEYHKHDPTDPASHRRSIYRFIVRSQPDPFMTTLDCADSSQSVPRRDETVTSLQALSMMNNKFMLTMAAEFGARVSSGSKDDASQALNAFRLATGREPTAEQLRDLVEYSEEFGIENACRLLFNLNEFVFVD